MLTRLAAAAFAFLPFAFALMRAVQTNGLDLRYLWVAFAAFVGAMVRMVLASRGGVRPMTRGTLAAGVFFMSTVAASDRRCRLWRVLRGVDFPADAAAVAAGAGQ